MCERNIDWLPLTRTQPGTRPPTQACALMGNRTSDLSVCGMMPNPLSYTRAWLVFILKCFYVIDIVFLYNLAVWDMRYNIIIMWIIIWPGWCHQAGGSKEAPRH